MAFSILDEILDAVTAQINNLGLVLTVGTVQTPIPCVKRKLPVKQDPPIDPAYQVIVCGKPNVDKFKRLCYRKVSGSYDVQITIVAPNNDDQLTLLPEYTQWRQKIRRLFTSPPLLDSTGGPVVGPNGEQVRDLDVQDDWGAGVFLDREEIADQYDFQALGLRVSTVEPKS